MKPEFWVVNRCLKKEKASRELEAARGGDKCQGEKKVPFHATDVELFHWKMLDSYFGGLRLREEVLKKL